MPEIQIVKTNHKKNRIEESDFRLGNDFCILVHGRLLVFRVENRTVPLLDPRGHHRHGRAFSVRQDVYVITKVKEGDNHG
jgi:hypothetical protein